MIFLKKVRYFNNCENKKKVENKMGNSNACCGNRENDPSHMIPSNAPGDPIGASSSPKRSKNKRDILVDRTFKNLDGSNRFSL